MHSFLAFGIFTVKVIFVQQSASILVTALDEKSVGTVLPIFHDAQQHVGKIKWETRRLLMDMQIENPIQD